MIRPRRSALYMPASNARAIAKARALPADVVILDLEDAVAPDSKVAARDQAVEAVRSGGFGPREIVVRVNGLDTPWGMDDLRAAIEAAPDAILVPKVSSPDDVARLRAAMGPGADGIDLWAMIETPRALLALASIGAASQANGLTVWVVGTNDLCKDLRCSLMADRAPLWGPLSSIVAATRAYDLGVLDGVFNDIDNAPGLEAECRQSVAFGFDGKTLIHPRQLEICNRIFGPSDAELAWANRVIAAFALPENATKGVIRVDGRMTERLHLGQAERLLAIADATVRTEPG